MRPVHLVVSDLERASRRGELTPTFLEHYAAQHGERIAALYALAQKNHVVVNIEEGRNDHLLREWGGAVDMDAMSRAMEQQAVETYRKLRQARGDGRPSVLRRAPSRFSGFVAKPQPAASAQVHRCPPGCTCDLA